MDVPAVLNEEQPGAPPSPAIGATDLAESILVAARSPAFPHRLGTLDSLTLQLRAVDPTAIEGEEARIAFWINLYNALLLHRLLLAPVRGSVLRQLRLFSRVAYEVGGRLLSLRPAGPLRPQLRGPFLPVDSRLRVRGSRRPARARYPRLPAGRDQDQRRARPGQAAAADAALRGRLRPSRGAAPFLRPLRGAGS